MIIALASQKGGTGKTTTASVMWSALPHSLAIDLDVQRSLSLICNANLEPEYDIFDVLTGACPITDVVQELPQGDFVTASIKLADVGGLAPTALRSILKPIRDKYSHIILDAPPALNVITLNALCAADIVIVPIQADRLSFFGLEQLMDMVSAVRAKNNPDLRIGGLLLTRFNSRSIIRRQMQDYVEQYATSMKTRVFKSTIREAVAIVEAQALCTDIFSYAPKSRVARDYRAFITELTKVVEHV